MLEVGIEEVVRRLVVGVSGMMLDSKKAKVVGVRRVSSSREVSFWSMVNSEGT